MNGPRRMNRSEAATRRPDLRQQFFDDCGYADKDSGEKDRTDGVPCMEVWAVPDVCENEKVHDAIARSLRTGVKSIRSLPARRFRLGQLAVERERTRLDDAPLLDRRHARDFALHEHIEKL